MRVEVVNNTFCSNAELVSVVKEAFPEVGLNTTGKRYSKEELISKLKDINVAIVGLDKIDKEILENCKDLKTIIKYGVGVDNINFSDCKNYGVKVKWREGTNKNSVAELTLGFMLGLSRNWYITSNQLKKELWNKDGGRELSGMTIGIIGMGHVGKHLVKLLKPFGCKILVNDIIDQKSYYVENGLIEASKEDIFSKADIISLHVSLNNETVGLVNKRLLTLMKKNSFLINTSRGQVVNEEDLLWALENRIIAGAAVDVYNEEPPKNKRLLEMSNLICTPHIGGNSKEAVLAMGYAVIELLKETLENKE